MAAKIERIGVVYGMVTVLEQVETRTTGTKPVLMYLCKCECGNEKIMSVKSLATAKSCGCKMGFASGTLFKHGACNSVEYSTWEHMKLRCYSKNNKRYPRYGGRGVIVCDRWKSSFENFLEDMGERPSNKHSIDRIDNDGNYEPSNCRWATLTEQANNTSKTIFLTDKNGIKKSINQWAELYNLKRSIIYYRQKYVPGFCIDDMI